MTDPQLSVIAREHTILGVCEALGEDFGFNPIWLRLLFAVPLMYMPGTVLAAYLGLGAVVFVSRLLSPVPGRRKAKTSAVAPAEPAQMPLPLAA